MTDLKTAEESVIGAVLLSNGRALDRIELDPADFYSRQCEETFRQMLAARLAGEGIDYVTISAKLKAADPDCKVDTAWLFQVMSNTPTAANVETYAEIVKNAATNRRLEIAAGQIIQRVEDGEPAERNVDFARKVIDEAAHIQRGSVKSLGESMEGTLEQIAEDPRFIPTPWRSINDIIGGVRPGNLVTIGARPSVGKTVAGLQLAMGMLRHGAVAFVSLEMSESEIHKRLIAYDLKIDLRRLNDNQLTKSDWALIFEARPRWAQLPLFINDDATVTVAQIHRFARSVSRRRPLVGVVVDYLQLMKSEGTAPRHEQVAQISRSLKMLAKELDVPVIALSQLNRKSEERETKMPTMADMRESGAIEQDSDVVILLHRDMTTRAKAAEMVMAVAKNRHGETRGVDMQFLGRYAEIRDIATATADPYLPILPGAGGFMDRSGDDD